jgi:hypothetical protein
MPAFQKRAAKTAEDFPEPKKAKKAVVEDHVQTKVDTIIAALHDDSFEVPGTKSNREMLIAMAPCILATPRDQRHAHMESMVKSFQEVFADEASRLQDKVAEGEGAMAEASRDLASRKAEAESAASDLQMKVDEVKGKQVDLAESVGVTRNAETTLKDTKFELSTLVETKSDLAREQEEAQARMENFNMFKNGDQESAAPKEEHNLLKTLASFLKKIKADVSLVAALPMALGRKPAERTDFDANAVVEVEKKLEEKLREVAAGVQSNEALIAEKTDFQGTSEKALVNAKEKQRALAEAMLAVRADQKELTTILATKKEAVIEQEFTVKALEGEHNEKLSFFKAHQEKQSTLTELIERDTPVEADVEVVAPMEEVIGAVEAIPETVHEAV